MPYPSLEQYQEALQHPQTALTDPVLRSGKLSVSGLGLPLALCGGFALTYTVNANGKKYALRCFHKQANHLEKRYEVISRTLKQINSPYFVDFEFQKTGVRINGGIFPVVRMEWASGETLGEFMEKRRRDVNALTQLKESFRQLSQYLNTLGISHGDIQPGNVMVSDNGNKIVLIDYDGMFVKELKSLGSSESGQRNFQHPQRTGAQWDDKLDRFAFITLELSLEALRLRPDLWDKTQSDPDAFLFRASDYASPQTSATFRHLTAIPECKVMAEHYARICRAKYDSTPTLGEFILGRNIPVETIAISITEKAEKPPYTSVYQVLDALRYEICVQHVGDKVELIGRITDVSNNKTKYGKPYVFINFGDWHQNIVKINIWSEGLSALSDRPDEKWIGRWVSVVGMIEPPYTSKRYHYTHISITVTQSTQIKVLTQEEAYYRLGKKPATPVRGPNKPIQPTGRKPDRSPTPPAKTKTANELAIEKMRQEQGLGTVKPPAHRTSSTAPVAQTKKGIDWGCVVPIAIAVIAIVIYIISQVASK